MTISLVIVDAGGTRSLVLSEGTHRIGSAAEAVVLLSDAAPHHATLTVGPQVELELHAPGEINGQPMSAGRRATLRAGQTFAIGAATLVLRPGAPLGPAAPGAEPLVLGPSMTKLVGLVDRIAQGHGAVLVLGETGVGKERISERIHRASPRNAGPYVKLNCAALTETLLESELFGHEKGAFTGAVSAKPGLLETGDGGTVLLDEVGELPLATQAKLLRVIEDKQVFRVGSLKGRPIDVRFVAATNRDLESAIQQGRFRQDLYFRLNGASVWVPPLRERAGDILPLANHFLGLASGAAGKPAPKLRPDACAVLTSFDWPGNVRQLRNVMEQAVLLCGSGDVTSEHLPVDELKRRRPKAPAALTSLDATPTSPAVPEHTPALSSKMTGTQWKKSLAAVERKRISRALEAAAGNQSIAAKALGLSRRTLINRLDALGFPRPRKKK